MSKKFIQGLSLIAFLILCFTTQIGVADSQFTKRKDVQTFIHMMVHKHHFNARALQSLLQQIKIRQKIIKAAHKPLEESPWNLYQMLFVNEWRIEHGVKYWNKHADSLKRAERQYGVPAAIIVATLGVETKYGQRIGGHRVIDALGNLAFNQNHRHGYFRKELECFLLLTRKYHLDPLKVMGSYAGAIGQPQFMPSSYLRYGIKLSKRGYPDLIHNDADAIASIANYYHQHGWRRQQPVAVRAYLLSKRYNFSTKKNTQRYMTIAQLNRYGVIPKYKASADHALAKVITLEKSHTRYEYWLGFHNFEVIKRYNASNLYAMAVYQLSHYISELREKLHDD